LTKWAKANTRPNLLLTDASVKSLIGPLVFEPGSSFAYGTSLDWAGLAVQRVSDMTLEEYFQRYIFSRVDGGMPGTSFYLRPDIARRKSPMLHRKNAKGAKYLYDRAMKVEEVSRTFHSGGEGLFGTTRDYLAFLRAVLQCDPRHSAPLSVPLITAESYRELFKPAVKTKRGLESLRAFGQFAYHEHIEAPGDLEHSVGFILSMTDSRYGRRKGSGSWWGAAKTYYWLDPVKGIAVSRQNLVTM
jgi:methyl acetate hydrolase